MKTIYIGFNKEKFFWSTLDELREIAIKFKISIGSGCSIGYNCFIGPGCSIGFQMSLLIRTKVPKETELNKIISIQNAYKYHVSAWFNKGKKYVAMGCFTKTEKQWRKNFWNNPDEFKKGSEDGIMRKKAFEVICKLAEEIK